jgi:hypothetical protein
MLGTMADAFANPIMVDALILAREGTIAPDTSSYGPALPNPIDSPADMVRWEPWVRAYVAIGEMLQGIIFQKTTTSGVIGFQVLWSPPSPSSSSPSLIAEIERPQKTTFDQQIPRVLSWAELRDERATEIMAQIDPTYAFWSSIIYMHPDRTKRTFELINMVLQFCVYVEMRFKHALACWRPVEYNAQVQPMITTPGHGAFPSGHATQAFAVAHVLTALLKQAANATKTEQLKRQAARIATNRVVAGVHFPVDSMAGRMLGEALGEYFVGRCTGSGQFNGRKFIAAGIDADPSIDFNPFATTQALSGSAFYSETAGAPITTFPLMGYLWNAARAEWSVRFP